MRTSRSFAALTCVCAVLVTGTFVGNASAASVPANDTIGAAKNVKVLPFTQSLDTTQATTDADDAQVNETCGAPVTNASVWYTFTAGATDTLLVVDTTGSDYSSGVIIATGDPGALTTEACGPISTLLAVSPGTKYYILVFDDTNNGGTLQLSMHGPGPQPPNDKIIHATEVGAVPFTDSVDTTGATTSASDKQANASCGAPAVGNSVWYKFTATSADPAIFADASFSNYNAGVLIATGMPGSLTTVSCGPFGAAATTTAGTTYYIMAFDFAGGGGGNLALNIGDAPTVNLGVKRSTFVDGSGVAYVKGLESCSNANDVEVFGSLVEVVRRSVTVGSFDDLIYPATCNGKGHPWEAAVVPTAGMFTKGRAALLVSAFACGDTLCVQTDQAVVLDLTRTAPTASGSAAIQSVHTKVVARSRPHAYGTVGHSVPLNWGR